MWSIAQVNAIWRVPLILLWTASMATLSLILSLFDREGNLQHWCARVWSRFILKVSRVQVDIQGLQQLSPDRGYLLAANHLSMFDHWALLAYIPFQFRFVAKASLFQIPFLGWHLRRSGHVAVYRHNHRQTLRSFKQAAQRINGGVSFVIYPEGMRTWGDSVGPFKRGSLQLARYANAPIVPITFIGAHRRLLRGSMVIIPGRMEMIVHPPIEFDQYRDVDPDTLTSKVRETIAEHYRQVS